MLWAHRTQRGCWERVKSGRNTRLWGRGVVLYLLGKAQPPSGEELARVAALSANQGGARAAKLLLVFGNQ